MRLLRLRAKRILPATVAPPEPVRGRCQAITSKGDACKLPSEPGTARCVFHRHKPTAASS